MKCLSFNAQVRGGLFLDFANTNTGCDVNRITCAIGTSHPNLANKEKMPESPEMEMLGKKYNKTKKKLV